MKDLCKCALRTYLSGCLRQARKDANLTQVKFSEKLMMDPRSYIALEHGDNLCCTLTLILFIVFFCKDPDTLIANLRNVILNTLGDDSRAS